MLNLANTICMGQHSDIRYRVHHSCTLEDERFWSLAWECVLLYKKQQAAGDSLGWDAAHGHELLRHGCGSRLESVYVEEVRLSSHSRSHSPSQVRVSTHEIHHSYTSSAAAELLRLVSWSKFEGVVLRELRQREQEHHMQTVVQHGRRRLQQLQAHRSELDTEAHTHTRGGHTGSSGGAEGLRSSQSKGHVPMGTRTLPGATSTPALPREEGEEEAEEYEEEDIDYYNQYVTSHAGVFDHAVR